jgi:pimeloyl-ACP methyl ester carboxylesterase
LTAADSGAHFARRIDTAGAFSEEVGFFDTGLQRVFGVLHRPMGPAAGGLVICPSIYAEFTAGYGIDVSLARALAARGLAVQRFHYRGAGHSDGEADEMSFESMREDALVAADRLVDRTAAGGLAFLGTRFGGLVAASAAAEYPTCPLVLIEPTLEAGRFFRDAWRAALIRDVKEGSAPRAQGEGLAGALAHEGTVDVLGYAISRPFFENAAGRTLVGELAGGGRRVLLVQLGRASSLRSDVEAAVATLRERGCHVDVELVAEDVTWWFPPGAEAKQPKRHALVELTSAWLSGNFAAVLA